jgi:sulfur carrier protein ThiS
MQNTQEIVTALKAQFDAITTRLAAIDKEQAATLAQYKEQRAKVAAEAAPLAQALRALGVQVAGVATAANGVRRPMSQEAKDRIREGLRKAAEKKRLAGSTPALQQELLQPVAAASTPAKKAVPAKKAGARG